MTECICVVCKKEKKHYAKGMCKKCYNTNYKRNNLEKVNKIMRDYRRKNPERVIAINDKCENKRHKRETCEIIKSHEIRHADDPESLDIRKLLNVECEE